MIDMPRLFDLLQTGAISEYRGEIDVVADKGRDMVVIGQGDERILVLTQEQALSLVQVIMFKLGQGS